MARNKLAPLKNKLISCCGNNNECGFSEKDVASAVAWLKEEIERIRDLHCCCDEEIDEEGSCYSCALSKIYLIKVSEAFSDVCESGSGEVNKT